MKQSIGVIGGGNMGSAIIRGISPQFKIFICEKDKQKGAALKRSANVTAIDLAKVVEQVDAVVLAVKPQDSDEVLSILAQTWTPGKLLISIAAGLTTGYLEKRLGKKARVVRTMPNMPAMIGQGVTAICRGRNAKAADLKLAVKIFSSVGKTVVLTEDEMDAVTAVSGSGPAYVFILAECWLAAAEKVGLKPTVAQHLVLETLKGSVALLAQSSETPAALRARVTSKGGTTQAALEVFLARRIEEIFLHALTAAKKRSGELAKV